MTDEIGVLRLCRCCLRWLSIDGFKPLAKICEQCMRIGHGKGRPSGTIARTRGMALTQKGRAALKSIA